MVDRDGGNIEIRLYCDDVDSARDELFDLCSLHADKLASRLGNGYITVTVKKNKEEFRGKHERECHLSVNTVNCKESVHSTEWGAPEAIKSAFSKLKSLTLKAKEERVSNKKVGSLRVRA